MKYPEALAIAEQIVAQLAPYCEDDRCLIAGSIRRKREGVGDIEIVCHPKSNYESPELPMLLFDENAATVVPIRTGVDTDFARIVLQLGKIIKGKPDGRMVQIELPQAIMLDLFMPQPEDFYRVFAIRTGSRDYSQKVIAAGWRKIGWVGTSDGLRLIEQSVETKREGQSSTWKCTVSRPTLPPVWKSEQEFFDWIKVKFIAPEKREI